MPQLKDKKKASCFGFWRYGNNFLNAAIKICPVPISKYEEVRLELSIPAYYLIGHAIELLLKSFLLARGETIEILRSQKKYGHNLEKLLMEASRRKLGCFVKLKQSEKRLIILLNTSYMQKEFEYFELGYISIPKYKPLVEIANKLCSGIKAYSVRQTKQTNTYGGMELPG